MRQQLLNSFLIAATISVSIAQQVRADIIQEVTGVKIKATPNGVEVILETKGGGTGQVFTSSYGQTFFADVISTRLRLPQGGSFRQDNPAEGIASVTVTPLDANSIRVRVIGRTQVPTVQGIPSDRKLVFNLSPSADTAATPAQTPTPATVVTPTPSPAPETVTRPTPGATVMPTPSPAPETVTRPAPTPGTPPAASDTPDGTLRERTPRPSETPTVRTRREQLAPGAKPEPIEIIVVAEKVEENLLNVPLSVTVITENEIENSSIRTVQDLTGVIPNLSLNSIYDYRSNGSTRIRGLGGSDLDNVADPGVQVVIDDVPSSFSGFVGGLELLDVERIEVLRGPQSTLYGRNATGGVINVVTRRPTNEWRGQAAFSYGNYNNLLSQLSISGPIAKDRVYFSLAGSYSRRDGFTENTAFNTTLDDKEGLIGRAQLRFTPTDEWDISLIASAEAYNDKHARYALLDDPTPYQVQFSNDGKQRYRFNNQSLRVAYSGDNFGFTSITARRYEAQDPIFQDSDYTAQDIIRGYRYLYTTQWSQEFRFQSPETADRWQWLVGAFYATKDVDDDGGLDYGPDAPVFELTPGRGFTQLVQSNQTTYALFGQVTYKIIEPLSLTAGLRLEYNYRDLAQQTYNGPQQGTPDLAYSLEDTFTELIPRFALEYRFTPDLFAYASISRGYKSGGFSAYVTDPAQASFDPERSWSYEVGLKSSWLDDRLIANLALFYTKVDDFQVGRFDLRTASYSYTVYNAAEVTSKGFELDFIARPIRGLDLVAGFGYTDVEYDKFRDPIFPEISYVGNTIPYTPKYTYNLAVQYRAPNGFFGRVELRGLGEYFFFDNNVLRQEPFTLVNARIGYEFENYGVYLYANNLFNKNYIETVLDLNDGRFLATPSDRRTFGFIIRAQF